MKFLHSLEHKDNEELKKIENYLNEAVQKSAGVSSEQQLASFLTGGRTYSSEEKIALEATAQSRAYEHRRKVLDGALSSSQVAKLLNTSRQTPHDRVKSGSLLAVKENGQLGFPAWQFDMTGPNGVLEGLAEVLAALKINDFLKASWFFTPNRSLSGLTPVQALKQSDLKKVMMEARAVGAN